MRFSNAREKGPVDAVSIGKDELVIVALSQTAFNSRQRHAREINAALTKPQCRFLSARSAKNRSLAESGRSSDNFHVGPRHPSHAIHERVQPGAAPAAVDIN
jgi:hypothetical protein